MSRRVSLFLMAGLGAAFAFGLFTLFRLRFEAGDIYPPYSSLRSDPLGTMALYESLQRLPGVSVRRDFSSENRLPEQQRTVYLHLAANSADWKSMPEELVKEIEAFLVRGGRLAVCFSPASTVPFQWRERQEQTKSEKPKEKAKDARKASKRRPPNDVEGQDQRLVSLKERWGLEFGFAALEEGDADAYEPATVRNQTELPIPKSIDWHSGLIFTNVSSPWQTIYARGKSPVMIERAFGSGTLMMATDCYFLSNEALRKERHADLLAWVVGSGKEIVFDEAHFGIVEGSGVAMLIRRYHLWGAAAALLLITGLFVWKNSFSLVPPYSHHRPEDLVTGEEAAAGFVKLLRRNIRAGELLEICLAEWKKSLGGAVRRSETKLRRAEELVKNEKARPQHQRNAVRAYQDICSLLKTPGL